MNEALCWFLFFQCPGVAGLVLWIEHKITDEWLKPILISAAYYVAGVALGMLIYFYQH